MTFFFNFFIKKLPDTIFDYLYSTLVLNNKQFEEEYAHASSNKNSDTPIPFDMEIQSIRKLYLHIKRNESDPVYAKHLVLYFFRRLVVDCNALMRQHPSLLVKCLFGLIQVHLEYNSYFSSSDLAALLGGCGDENKLMASFDELLVRQWLGVYVSDWSDEYDQENTLDELVQSRFPLELFGFKNSKEFMNKYVHLVFDHCLNEFDRLPKKLASGER